MNYVEIKATSEEEETNEQKKWKSNQLQGTIPISCHFSPLCVH